MCVQVVHKIRFKGETLEWSQLVRRLSRSLEEIHEIYQAAKIGCSVGKNSVAARNQGKA